MSRRNACRGTSLAKSMITLAALAAVPSMFSTTRAAEFTWDNNGSTAPNPQDGAGTWDTTLLNWWNGASNAWNNTNLDTAVFGAGGTAGQVDITTPIAIGGLTFNLAGYTIAGGSLQLPGATAFTVNASGTISSAISGAGTLNAVIAPTATLTLNAANSFAAGSFTGGGTVNILAQNNGLGTGTASLDNVTLRFNDARSIGAHLNINNTVTLNGSGSANGTLNNGVSGTGTLVYTQAGTVTPNSGDFTTFSGTYQFTNTGTTLATLRFNNTNAGSPNALYDVGSGATIRLRNTGNVTIKLGAVTGQAGSSMQSSTSSGATNVNWEVGGKNIDTTFDGTIIDTNDVRITSITKVGTGKWTLGGANTYTGNTTINGGTLALSATGTLSATPSVAVNAAFDVSAVAGGYIVPAGQTLSGNGGTVHGNVLLSGSSGVVNLGTNSSGIGTAGTLTFANTLSVNGGTLNFSLLDTSATGHDELTVNTLDLAGTTNLVVAPISPGMGTGVYDLINYTSVTGGGLANLNLVPAARFSGNLVTSTPGVIQLNVISSGSALLRWNGIGAGSVNWDSNATQAWINTSTNNPDVFYNTDDVRFEDTSGVVGDVNIVTVVQPSSLVVENGPNVPTYRFLGTGTISGATSLVKNGSAGTLVVNTVNSYTGGTTINGGTIVVGNSNALSSGSILMTSGDAAFMMSGSGITMTTPINISADNAVLGGNGSFNSAIQTLGASTIRLSIPTSGSVVSLGNSATFTNLGGGNININVTDQSIGSLRFAASTPNATWGSVNWNLGDSSVTMFNRDSARNILLGSLAGGPNTSLRGNSNTGQGITTFTIGGGDVSSTVFAGRVLDGTVNNNTGTVAIVKTNGSLTFTNNNTYTGATTVNSGGTLIVNGSHTGGAAYTISGTLGGNGVIGSAVTVNGGGTLATGAPTGMMQVSTLSVADGGNLSAGFGSAGGSGVIVNSAGGATTGATVNVHLSDAGGAIAGQYPLLDYNGGGPNFANFNLNTGNVGALTASLVNNTAGSSVDVLLAGAGPVHAMWNTNANGDWSTAGNWTPSSPNGVDYQAYFGSIATSPVAVNVDAAKTVSQMHFNSSGGYMLSGSAITLDGSSGSTGINVYTGSHTIASAMVVNDALTVHTAGTASSLTVSGNVSGGVGITKTGQGNLVLSGSNSYAGTTTVSGGALLLGGTHTGGGAYSIASGASFGGSGTTSSAVTLASGASLRPGLGGIGSLTVGSLSLTSNSLLFDIGAAGADVVNVLGSDGLTLSGISTFTLSDLGGINAGQYALIDYSGTALAALTAFSLSSGTLGAFNVSLVNNTANTSVDLLVVPSVVTATWNVDTDGNWSAGANWTGGLVPTGIDATANFGTVITAPRTVTVDSAQTLGTMNFSSPNSYTVAGAAALTMDVSSGQAAINVTAGSHVVSAPVTLNDDLTITADTGTGVALSGNLTATGRTITKAGAGTAQFANVRAAGLNVSAGSAQISAKGTANDPAGTSVVNSLSIASGASLDLTNNSMVIDYTTVGTLVDDTRQHLAAGRLTTSAATPAGAKLGYADNAVLGLASFAGQTVDTTSLLVKFTYAGDTNLDGQVDITDLGNLATNWQTAGVWTAGDSDYSGFIDITDLGALATNWQAGVGNPLGPSFNEALAAVGLGGVSVPEPATTGLVGLGLAGMLRRRRSAR